MPVMSMARKSKRSKAIFMAAGSPKTSSVLLRVAQKPTDGRGQIDRARRHSTCGRYIYTQQRRTRSIGSLRTYRYNNTLQGESAMTSLVERLQAFNQGRDPKLLQLKYQ